MTIEINFFRDGFFVNDCFHKSWIRFYLIILELGVKERKRPLSNVENMEDGQETQITTNLANYICLRRWVRVSTQTTSKPKMLFLFRNSDKGCRLEVGHRTGAILGVILLEILLFQNFKFYNPPRASPPPPPVNLT